MALTAERLVAALMTNLDMWIEQVDEILEAKDPHRPALHLKRGLLQTQYALRKMKVENCDGE